MWSDSKRQTDADKKQLEKISNDKSTIVRFTHCPSKEIYVREKNKDGHDSAVLKPENFFAMAYEEQYLYFNGLGVQDGVKISKILEWGFNHEIDHGHITNLIEELESNFNKYELDDYISDDGIYEFLHAKGLEALWQLIPKLGDTKPAQYLVWSLPMSGILFDNKVIESVMKSLPKNLVLDLKERKKTCRAKHEKRETIKSFALVSIFIFGVICSFLDINGWGIFICIAIPSIVWTTQSIKQSLNNVIDNVVKKTLKKLKMA